MKRHAFILLVVLALLAPSVSTAGSLQKEPPRPLYAPGEVVISWEPGAGPVSSVAKRPEQLGGAPADAGWQAAAAELRGATGLEVLGARPDHGFARLAVRTGDEEAEVARLAALPWVRFAQLNHTVYMADASYPNDPDFAKQWNLHRVKAAEAWSATQGSLSFIVAVIDTGVARGHPDFAGQLLNGYNYVSPGQPPEDDSYNSHGTHVTGILAARTNNGVGVAGLAPNIKILPLKVLNSQGGGREDTLAAAIYDAADQQAQVLNLSLITLNSSPLIQNAVLYAQQRGGLIVAAGGNCAQDYANCGGQINPPAYPAAYSGVLAVGASDRFDRTTPYSGYKPYIGLAAPGGTAQEPIWSTTRTGYGPLYGTSMSTPLVSAAAALIWTLRPAATATEIADILKSTADQVGTDVYSGEPLAYANGRNDYFGAGRLNVANAVRWVYPPSLSAATDQVRLLLGGAKTTATQSVGISNPSSQGVYWTASVVSGSPWLSLPSSSGTSVYGGPTALTLRVDRLALQPGVYVGVIRVQPIFPTGLAAVEIRVQLQVSASLVLTYAPLIGRDMTATWLDPDAPGALQRSVLPLSNDMLVPVGLPFAVPFMGAVYPTIQASDNGLVIFGLNSAPATAPTACPGDGRLPNNAVYVLAYDWNPALGGRVIVHQPSTETFVITWQDVRRAGNALPQSFQLVIQSDGTIRGNYRMVESPLPGIIGAENYDGAFAQQVLCNGAGRQVKNGETVRFEAQLPW